MARLKGLMVSASKKLLSKAAEYDTVVLVLKEELVHRNNCLTASD